MERGKKKPCFSAIYDHFSYFSRKGIFPKKLILSHTSSYGPLNNFFGETINIIFIYFLTLSLFKIYKTFSE